MLHTPWRAWLVVLLIGQAFYLPSSIGGVISRPLSILALVSTCALLSALALAPRGIGRPYLVLNSLAMLALPLLFTITSGLVDFSPGAIFLYLGMALLYVVNLRSLPPTGAVRAAFIIVNMVSLAIGFATVLGVDAVTAFIRTYYAAYYAELVPNMVGLHKPVLTFATHSTAGFMEYLLFFMALKTFEARSDVRYAALALAYVGLMVALRSTTSTILAVVAVLQIIYYIGQRYQRTVTPMLLAAGAGAVVVLVGFGFEGSRLITSARAAILGDRISGLVVRYAEGGLLASDFTYLSRHPLSPVGFGFSSSLYFGDSGFVVNMLRGSLPLTLAVYGGLLMFLLANLTSRNVALWIWAVVLAFEVGFTPLQYFRFLGFVPFMIVYLNSLRTSSPPAASAV
jgi:hypothetical protein